MRSVCAQQKLSLASGNSIFPTQGQLQSLEMIKSLTDSKYFPPPPSFFEAIPSVDSLHQTETDPLHARLVLAADLLQKSLSGKLTPFCTVHCSTGHCKNLWKAFQPPPHLLKNYKDPISMTNFKEELHNIFLKLISSSSSFTKSFMAYKIPTPCYHSIR